MPNDDSFPRPSLHPQGTQTAGTQASASAGTEPLRRGVPPMFAATRSAGSAGDYHTAFERSPGGESRGVSAGTQ